MPKMPSHSKDTMEQLDYATIDLCDCDGFWHTASTEDKPSEYLDDLVKQEREAAVQSFAYKLKHDVIQSVLDGKGGIGEKQIDERLAKWGTQQ